MSTETLVGDLSVVKSGNIADRLNQKICALRSHVVVGLDPALYAIPDVYKTPYLKITDQFEAVGKVFFDFNKDLIDSIVKIAPAVKLQIAFYEKYGVAGLKAFQKTVSYARSRGLMVFGDGKRNDIGNTVEAYASGHLGKVELLSGEKKPSLDLDWLTVSPFLGKDSLDPFIKTCIDNDRGIFVLVKTSNPSSGDIQNARTDGGNTVSMDLAEYISGKAQCCVGDSGYSSIGAVVGATFPKEAEALRRVMPNSIFLVPGYGIQGGNAGDVVACFNDDALGAIVNNSREIMTSWQKRFSPAQATREDFKYMVAQTAETMRNNIILALKDHNKIFRSTKCKMNCSDQ